MILVFSLMTTKIGGSLNLFNLPPTSSSSSLSLSVYLVDDIIVVNHCAEFNAIYFSSPLWLLPPSLLQAQPELLHKILIALVYFSHCM